MYHYATLPNGLKVIGETLPHLHSVSLGVWIGAGSRYEEPEVSGISHFIEHMMFKGTARRSTKEIAETIDAVGGQLNAFTAKEYTCYYAKLLDQHLQLGVDLLADMVNDSLFLPAEIEKEQSVVLEEIKSYQDAPDELIHDLFVARVLKDHELGRSILGNAQTISRLSQEILFDYLRQHYTPDNMIFAVAGNIQFDQVIAEIEPRFAKLQGRACHICTSLPPVRAEEIYICKDTEQVHLCIGGRGVARKDSRKYAVILLDNILGGSVSSRLFQRLREEEGLVYVTGSSHSAFLDTGVFSIYAGTSMAHFERVVALIKEELVKIRQIPVDSGELTRTKQQLKGNLLLSLESTCNRMNRLAKAALFDEELLTPEAVVEKLDAVTAAELQEVARELFDPEKLVMVALGPFF